MAGVYYRPEPGFAAAIAKDPGVLATMEANADAVLTGVQAAWPVGKTGRGRASLFIGTARNGAPTVESSFFGWHWVEFGSVNNPPYAPFRRGVESAGLRYEDPGFKESVR